MVAADYRPAFRRAAFIRARRSSKPASSFTTSTPLSDLHHPTIPLTPLNLHPKQIPHCTKGIFTRGSSSRPEPGYRSHDLLIRGGPTWVLEEDSCLGGGLLTSNPGCSRSALVDGQEGKESNAVIQSDKIALLLTILGLLKCYLCSLPIECGLEQSLPSYHPHVYSAQIDHFISESRLLCRT